MKTVGHKMITERIRLADALEGDNIRLDQVPRTPGATWSAGMVTIVRVKPVGGDVVQVKYRKQGMRVGKVIKAEFDGSRIVERTRLATAADGPGAGTAVPERIVVDRVAYDVTDRTTPVTTSDGRMVDIDGLDELQMADLLIARRGRGLDLGGYAAVVLGMAVMASGGALRLPD